MLASSRVVVILLTYFYKKINRFALSNEPFYFINTCRIYSSRDKPIILVDMEFNMLK